MISQQYSPAIHAAIRIGKKMLNRYYSKTDHTELYCIAMGMYLNYISALTQNQMLVSFGSTSETLIFSVSLVGDGMD